MEHLTEIQHMLPYIVAAKHTNYMSCLPLYLKEMRDLEEKHPAIYNDFNRGRFAVHRTEGRFNGIWTDMALEHPYNKEGKTSFVKGISQNPGARDKYIKSVPLLSHVSGKCEGQGAAVEQACVIPSSRCILQSSS